MSQKSKKRTKYTTLKDVAERANTSITTVSYILNNSKNRYVSDELRKRVLDAAEELNYTKSAVASSLKVGQGRGIIAVLVPQFGNSFFTRISIAIEEVAREAGYVITICNTYDDPQEEKEIIMKLIEQRVDGFIISPTVEGRVNTEILRTLEIPYVIMDRALQGIEDYDFIGSDNVNAGYLAAKQLIDHGHTNVGFVGWKTEVSYIEGRKEGYLKAMDEAGLPVNPSWIQTGGLDIDIGYELTQKLLDQSSITSVILAQHVLAEGGVQHIRERGMEIPKDISLIIIGTPRWTRLNDPVFTCVKQPEQQIGEKSATRLIEKIKNMNHPEGFIHEKLSNSILSGHSIKTILSRSDLV